LRKALEFPKINIAPSIIKLIEELQADPDLVVKEEDWDGYIDEDRNGV
jgi:hypothetical protein